jgi:hypothetical protein
LIRLLALALRAAFVLVALRLFLRFVAAVVRGYRGEEGRPGGRGSASERDLVRDRICNTFVPKGGALHAVVAGETQYFCSVACRDAALLAARRAS